MQETILENLVLAVIRILNMSVKLIREYIPGFSDFENLGWSYYNASMQLLRSTNRDSIEDDLCRDGWYASGTDRNG